MLLEQYDSDRDGQVSLPEFLSEVAPHSEKQYL